MRERRKHKRLNEKTVVVYKLPKEAKIEEITESKDLGAGGIRISIPKKVIKGDILSLDVNILNDSIPILAEGEVVWVKKDVPGTKGKNKGPDEQEFIVGIKFRKFGCFGQERVIEHIKRKLSAGNE